MFPSDVIPVKIILNIEMFSFDVTPVRIMLNMEMLNRPLSKMPTDIIELCNCSFDMQPNLIKDACHLVYQ